MKESGRKLLRCDGCGRTIEITMSDQMAYLHNGWPKCCGQTMVLWVAVGRLDEAAPKPEAPESSEA